MFASVFALRRNWSKVLSGELPVIMKELKKSLDEKREKTLKDIGRAGKS